MNFIYMNLLEFSDLNTIWINSKNFTTKSSLINLFYIYIYIYIIFKVIIIMSSSLSNFDIVIFFSS